MAQLRKILESRPALVRVLPFAVCLGLTLLQGRLGPASLYWGYLLKALVGACLVWLVWPLVASVKWKLYLSW